MKLIYNPELNPMAKSNVFRMAKVTLKAGVNDLTETQVDALKSHPEFDKFIELGMFDDGDSDPVVKRKRQPKSTTPILLEMPEK
jgi:hypothetical protein